MQNTPTSLRKHVVLIGETNAGKSTLFNALLGQQKAIISEKPGTTTDPVSAAMELIPFGPIMLYDTAGFGDQDELSKLRAEKTEDISRRADAAIYVCEYGKLNAEHYNNFLKKKIPHLLAFTKCKDQPDSSLNATRVSYANALFVPNEIALLREKLSSLLQQENEQNMFSGLLAEKSMIALVVKIDSAAPKGRLILPQVQLIRDCVDNNIICIVTSIDDLQDTLNKTNNIDLIVTDSQLFNEVANIVPKNKLLTSVSMLIAHQRADFDQLLTGAKQLNLLKQGDKILMLEGCTHNATHEDIGRVKIPKMLMKKLAIDLQFEYFSGYDFPKNLNDYSLAISCASCMLNQQEITKRLEYAQNANLPITNYGMVLAWGNGILERCCKIFLKETLSNESD